MSISVQCLNDGDERDYARDVGRLCGSLLPTGNPRDLVDGLWVSCIDGGMPLVICCAYTLTALELDTWPVRAGQTVCGEGVSSRVNRIRLQAGYLMNLGDVSRRAVPELTIVNDVPGDAHCFAYLLSAEGTALPLGQAQGASLAMAAMTADTLVHEAWPAVPPLTLRIDTLGASLRYRSSI